ncbi:uncharacterized protein LOC143287572 [Babylonia areolata]|uniref:uncharacterized protein LOC143287572 n=1 Tax=Babylonia areolata TaxID=304850 RepID=UPI003FCFB2B2
MDGLILESKQTNMASSFTFQFQPQPPPVPRMTGGKRGPSGPLIVPSSSEDEDSDTSECQPTPPVQQMPVKMAEVPRSPRNIPVLPLATPRSKIGGGKFAPCQLSPRKDTASMITLVSSENVISETVDNDSDTETTPSLPSSPRGAAVSPSLSNFAHEHDHDYENVASPCSSTASGPIYVRPPGFTHHAQEVESVKSKLVRKKSRPAAVISLKEGFKKQEQTPPKTKPKREPLPMKLRALPQSFWQQPNVTQQVSPATMFPVLPPLCHKDTGEDMADVRPVTPPQDQCPESSGGDKGGKPAAAAPAAVGERKITVANTDLLFKLFENIGGDEKKAAAVQLKRGRPKRVSGKSTMKGLLSSNDPYLVDAMTDKLFPQLSLDNTSRQPGCNPQLQLVTVGTGDKSVTLPSLSVEQNYPQLLSELVMHI